MNQQSKAKMFLADERGCNETEWYRSYHTFNFKNYFNEHKQPFENLYLLNDETLAAGHTLNIITDENTILYLLPVVGTLCCTGICLNKTFFEPGQLLVSYSNNPASLQISNPYETELINFLQIRVKEIIPEALNHTDVFRFDINQNKNKLIPVTIDSGTNTTSLRPPQLISVGKFEGRKEAVYKLTNDRNSLFVFIIQGAFEVQGRLLHARDGLALWDEPEDIELEALSNDAIVLMIEQTKR